LFGNPNSDVIYNKAARRSFQADPGQKNMSDDITPYVFGGLQMDNFRFSKK